MSVIRFMFEGAMERVGVPQFLRPIFRGRSVRVEWSRRYEGREEVIKSIPKLARVECAANTDTHIFALVDYHPRHPRWTAIDEFRRGILKTVDLRLQQFIHIHVAMHDIESWILCDRSQLTKKLSLPEDQISGSPEEINLDNPPKYVIRKLFRERGRQYRETAEGAELLGRLHIGNVYQRCAHFRLFLDDLAQTANLDLVSILGRQQ